MLHNTMYMYIYNKWQKTKDKSMLFIVAAAWQTSILFIWTPHIISYSWLIYNNGDAVV